jgi:exopolysaccharide production protein ExoQ
MGKLVATIFFILLIWQLYRMTRDDGGQTSRALWLPTYWFFIGLTRNLSDWLHMSGGGGGYTEGSPLDRAALTLVLLLGVIVLLRRARKVGTILRSNLPILLYFSYCLMSILWSDFPDVALKRWFRALGDVVMVLIVLTDPDWVAAVRRIMTRLGNALIPLSILFSRWYPQFGRQFSHNGTIYWSGVTGEKNELGMLSLIFGLAFLFYFMQTYREDRSSRRGKSLMAYAAVVAMAIYLLIGSQSATALATFFLAGIPMVLTFRYKGMRQPLFVHAMVLGALGIAVSALFLDVGSGMLSQMGRNTTLTGRTAVWHAALRLSGSPLVGRGFESFWVGPRYYQMAQLTGMTLNQAHNGYLEVYLNLGWVGIGFLALVLLAGYQRVVKAVYRMAPLANLRLAFVIFAISENFTEATFKIMNPPWIVFLLATMAITEIPSAEELPLPTIEKGGNLKKPKLPPPRSRVLVGSHLLSNKQRRFSARDDKVEFNRPGIQAMG